MLDSNPSAGKGRKLSYFDVSSACRLGEVGWLVPRGGLKWPNQNDEHPGRVLQYVFLGVFWPENHSLVNTVAGRVCFAQRSFFACWYSLPHWLFERVGQHKQITIILVELWVRYCARTCQESDLHCTLDTAESNIVWQYGVSSYRGIHWSTWEVQVYASSGFWPLFEKFCQWSIDAVGPALLVWSVILSTDHVKKMCCILMSLAHSVCTAYGYENYFFKWKDGLKFQRIFGCQSFKLEPPILRLRMRCRTVRVQGGTRMAYFFWCGKKSSQMDIHLSDFFSHLISRIPFFLGCDYDLGY